MAYIRNITSDLVNTRARALHGCSSDGWILVNVLQDELHPRVLLLHRTGSSRNLQSLGCSRIIRALRNIKTNYRHYSLPTGPYHESVEFRSDPYNPFLLR